jgi:hypothetical protein
MVLARAGRDLSARLSGGHAAADLFAFGHGQTPLGATRWVLLHPAGLEHEGSHRRPAFAEPAGDQPQRLTSSPPCPHLILLCCR